MDLGKALICVLIFHKGYQQTKLYSKKSRKQHTVLKSYWYIMYDTW